MNKQKIIVYLNGEQVVKYNYHDKISNTCKSINLSALSDSSGMHACLYVENVDGTTIEEKDLECYWTFENDWLCVYLQKVHKSSVNFLIKNVR